jgi:hypothetical protein
MPLQTLELGDIRVKPYFSLSRYDKIYLPLIGQLSQLLRMCPYKTAFPEEKINLYGPKTKLKVPLLVCSKASIAIVAQTSREHDVVTTFISVLKNSYDKSIAFGAILYDFLQDDHRSSLVLALRIVDQFCTRATAMIIGDLISAGFAVICKTEDLMTDRSLSPDKQRKFTPDHSHWPTSRKKFRSKK